MLILLPPSEGKTAPASGPGLDLAALSFPELGQTRSTVLAELTRQCHSDPDHAAALLGLGPKQSDDIGRNADLKRQPCGAAIDVYTGVLFDALGYSTQSARARRRTRQHVAISSGLWGLVRPADLIPAYRLNGSVTLPGLGTLARTWKEPVSSALAQTAELIIDLRSGTYVSLGPIPAAAADRAVTVRVLQEKAGRRTVVSHHNKATKGRLVRALMESKLTPRTPTALQRALTELGFHVEDDGVSAIGTHLDVIVD
ncbi:MAG: peroxide stress protein YaaA [Actinomycetes bacterium]